jgi:hypothetical protein
MEAKYSFETSVNPEDRSLQIQDSSKRVPLINIVLIWQLRQESPNVRETDVREALMGELTRWNRDDWTDSQYLKCGCYNITLVSVGKVILWWVCNDLQRDNPSQFQDTIPVFAWRCRNIASKLSETLIWAKLRSLHVYVILSGVKLTREWSDPTCRNLPWFLFHCKSTHNKIHCQNSSC